MSSAAYEDLHQFTLEETDDPERLARRNMFFDWIIEGVPERREKLLAQEARTMLRRALKVRQLALRADDEARIDACTDRETLERWHDQAMVATSAAEALR